MECCEWTSFQYVFEMVRNGEEFGGVVGPCVPAEVGATDVQFVAMMSPASGAELLGSGHMIMWENPNGAADVAIRFLQSAM